MFPSKKFREASHERETKILLDSSNLKFKIVGIIIIVGMIVLFSSVFQGSRDKKMRKEKLSQGKKGEKKSSRREEAKGRRRS